MSHPLDRIAARLATPCFVYLGEAIEQRAREVRAAFAQLLELSYAVKCNPHPAVLAALAPHVALLDVSSAGELEHALACGFAAAQLSFTGPGKRDPELELAAARRIGYHVLESAGEARRLAARVPPGGVQPVLARIAPAWMPRGFGVHMAGKPTPFGIDEEDLEPALAEIRALSRLKLAGFHVYAGTQCLNADTLAASLTHTAGLFRGLVDRHRLEPEVLVFGAGFGIPYHDGDVPLDLAALAQEAVPVLQELRAARRLRGTRLVLELGRYLVGEAGYYVTTVTHVKHSRGTEIAVCDGGMHHHLGACGHLGSVIHRNYPIAKLDADTDARILRYDLVGPLCTTIDTLGRGVVLPELMPGDRVAIGCSGAYGPTASPASFIQHPPARAYWLTLAGGRPACRDVTAMPAAAPGPGSRPGGPAGASGSRGVPPAGG